LLVGALLQTPLRELIAYSTGAVSSPDTLAGSGRGAGQERGTREGKGKGRKGENEKGDGKERRGKGNGEERKEGKGEERIQMSTNI